MASIIKIKRSSTADSVPSSLEVGEIAVNLFDRKLFVGNTSGVTAIGGEDFRLTTDEPTTSGDGAYIKLLGDSVLSTNSILLEAGSGQSITRQSNGTITFAIDSGAITNDQLQNDHYTISANNGSDLDFDLGETINIVSGDATGITTTLSANTITISGVDATSAVKGVAKFDSGDFGVSSGEVTLADSATGAVLTIQGTTNEVDVSRTNGTVTVGLPDDVTIAGQLDVSENAEVSGNGSFGGTLDVTGVTTLADATVGGQLNVSENIVTTGNTEVGAALTVTGATTLSSTLDVTGDVNFNSTTGSTSTSTGAVVVDGGAGIAENLYVGGDARIEGDTTIDGNLTVEGALTYISTSTVYADDGMFKLAANNAGDTVDTGIYGAVYHTGNTSYTYSGYFRDASDSGIFKFYKDLDVEPGQTVDVTDSNYTLAQVDAIIDGGTY